MCVYNSKFSNNIIPNNFVLNFLSTISLLFSVSRMNIFIQRMNPLTGICDWVVQNEDYDYHQEVARSAFADMLHDTERNQLYEMALKAAIVKMHSKGKKANVLDIGTGTGLLSMMAARHGADTIITCEAFKPMSDCAIKIIALNGYKDKIKVIPKRSTQLSVGPQGELLERCNILVTEVFDTELIGEGALSTFSHAHKELLEKDCIVVPESATIFAQVVECPLAQNWNKFIDIYNDDGEMLIQIPTAFKNCPGSAAVHDIQLSQLPESSINTLISSIPVLKFDWSGRTPFILERSTVKTLKAERDGIAQCIFVWWELQMDTEGKIILSCAPKWAHPLTKIDEKAMLPWRDHWMQAIYYLPKEVIIKKNQEIHLISSHAEYNLWFNLVSTPNVSDSDYVQQICQCTAHVAFSRTRIGQINNSINRKKHLAVLKKYVDTNTNALVISDGFYTALAAEKFGARKLYFVENNYHSRRLIIDVSLANSMKNVVVLPDLQNINESDYKKINMVIAEPYFLTSIIPWDNLLFLFLLIIIKKKLSNNVQIFPKKAVIKGVAMHFSDLYKIRSPLEKCEGFLMKDFDDLIQVGI